MPFAFVLPGSPQGYILIQRAVVADFGGFPNDNPHAVVNKESSADFRTGMNFYPRLVPGPLADPPG